MVHDANLEGKSPHDKVNVTIVMEARQRELFQTPELKGKLSAQVRAMADVRLEADGKSLSHQARRVEQSYERLLEALQFHSQEKAIYDQMLAERALKLQRIAHKTQVEEIAQSAIVALRGAYRDYMRATRKPPSQKMQIVWVADRLSDPDYKVLREVN